MNIVQWYQNRRKLYLIRHLFDSIAEAKETEKKLVAMGVDVESLPNHLTEDQRSAACMWILVNC